MIQKTLNDIAQKRFEELRSKMKLDFINETIDNINKKDIDKDKLNKIFESKPLLEVDSELSEQTKLIDNTFSFIESLNLPPQLSLAIGLIISGYKTNNMEDFSAARDAIKNHMYNGRMFPNAEEKGTEETNN